MSKTYHQLKTASVASQGSTTTFSFTSNPTSGRAILVLVAGTKASGYTCSGVTDNASGGSNSYAQIADTGAFSADTPKRDRIYAFLATNIVGGALTISIANGGSSGQAVGIIAVEFSATETLAFDVGGTAVDEFQVSTVSGPTATATGANADTAAFVVGASFWPNDAAAISGTVNSAGYTSLVASNLSSQGYYWNAVAGYKVCSGSETSAYQATLAANYTNQATLVVTFKESATAPGWTADPSITSKSASEYTVGFTPDKSATVYGVAVVTGSGAPSAAQIKLGQNSSGTTAKAAANKSVTGADTLVLAPSDVPVATSYDLYFALSNSGGDSAVKALTTEALAAPAFTVAATVTSQSSTVYTLGFTPDAACTIYGVAVIAGSAAPSIAQIKAGQNGSGGAAKANNSKAVTGADSFTLTPSDSPAFAVYDLYCVLSGNTGDSARRTLAVEYLDPPTGKSFTVLTSVHSTSPLYGTGAASGDTLVLATTTTPSGYAVTGAADGTVSYAAAGDTSRQFVVIDCYDYSAGAYLGAGSVVFNNQAPAGSHHEPFLYRKSVAITATDLALLAPDPEDDAVTATALDALPTGLSITSGVLSGTPTTYGNTVATLSWADPYGATTTEDVLFEIGDLVPATIGSGESTAVAAVEAVASLTTSISTASSPTVASGNVIASDPVAGTLVPYNAVIGLLVSTGSTLTITTTTLPAGAENVAYYALVAADGAVSTWSLNAGNLPTGVSLNTSTGVISGIPTEGGTFAITVGATNGSASDTQALTLTIAGIAPVILTTALPRAEVGVAYSQTVSASGDLPMAFSLTGALPTGLTLSVAGLISGIPERWETCVFTVTATNAEGAVSQQLAISTFVYSGVGRLVCKVLKKTLRTRRV